MGREITLASRFDKRHQDWIKKHWEYERWQRYNHTPNVRHINKYQMSHGFMYFHPLLYNGYFTKNKNLTSLIEQIKPRKRWFKHRFNYPHKYANYQQQRRH